MSVTDEVYCYNCSHHREIFLQTEVIYGSCACLLVLQMRSTVIITVVIIEKSSFGWKWHIWCACLSLMRSTVNTAVVIIWKSSFIQKYCIWCACLLQMRRSWKVTRIITRWCWTSSDPAKGFPQVSQRFVFFIPLVTKLLGWGEECYSGIAVSICLSFVFFPFYALFFGTMKWSVWVWASQLCVTKSWMKFSWLTSDVQSFKLSMLIICNELHLYGTAKWCAIFWTFHVDDLQWASPIWHSQVMCNLLNFPWWWSPVSFTHMAQPSDVQSFELSMMMISSELHPYGTVKWCTINLLNSPCWWSPVSFTHMAPSSDAQSFKLSMLIISTELHPFGTVKWHTIF